MSLDALLFFHKFPRTLKNNLYIGIYCFRIARASVCDILFPKYLEESLLHNHQTLSTRQCFYKNVRARGQLLPFVILNDFYIGFMCML